MEPFANDLDCGRRVVLSRAAPTLRSVETHRRAVRSSDSVRTKFGQSTRTRCLTASRLRANRARRGFGLFANVHANCLFPRRVLRKSAAAGRTWPFFRRVAGSGLAAGRGTRGWSRGRTTAVWYADGGRGRTTPSCESVGARARRAPAKGECQSASAGASVRAWQAPRCRSASARKYSKCQSVAGARVSERGARGQCKCQSASAGASDRVQAPVRVTERVGVPAPG